MTVHDSPDSDCSINNSPYAVESRHPNNNNYDTKNTILDNYHNGNPRTIIIPPLKIQNSEVHSECERLMPGEGLQSAASSLDFCVIQGFSSQLTKLLTSLAQMQ